MRPHRKPFIEPARVQVSRSMCGGRDVLVLVAQGVNRARACVLSRGGSDADLLVGMSVPRACPSHHDVPSLLRETTLMRADARDMAQLGAFSTDGRRGLATTLARTSSGVALAQGERPEEFGWRDVTWARRTRYEGTGYPAPGRGNLAQDGTGRRVAIKADGIGATPVGVHLLPGMMGGWTALAFARGRFTAALDDFLAGFDVAAARSLGPVNWSPEGHAFYAAPGRTGEWRRQAAAAWPGFAPLIARDPGLRDAVDAGEPLPGLLAERAWRTLAPDAPEPDPGAFRRLRALPADACQKDVEEALALACGLPVDWLPDDAAGWRHAVRVAGGLVSRSAAYGLGLGDLCRRAKAGWTGGRAEGDWGGPGGDALSLRGAGDVVHALAETLVAHCLKSRGADRGFELRLRVAGNLLYGGMAHAAVETAQAAWHGKYATFMADLPAHEGGNAWPALFDDFRDADGTLVTCLSDEAALKSEGSRDGGLEHCVGGYGRRCYVGSVHVASVRRGDGTGRLSTVAFKAFADGEGGTGLHVSEHKGPGNSRPCEASTKAVAALVAAVSRRALALSDEALAQRGDEGFKDSYDWREPGLMEQAFEAWRPHLRPAMAREGFEAFRDRAVEAATRFAGGIPAPVATVRSPRPEAVVVRHPGP